MNKRYNADIHYIKGEWTPFWKVYPLMGTLHMLILHKISKWHGLIKKIILLNTLISIFCTTFSPKMLLLSSVSFGLPPAIFCHLFNYPLPPYLDDVIYEQPLNTQLKVLFSLDSSKTKYREYFHWVSLENHDEQFWRTSWGWAVPSSGQARLSNSH